MYQAQTYLRDHQIFEDVLFPGAGFIDALLSLQQTFGLDTLRLEDITLERPLVLAEKPLRVQLVAKAQDDAYQLSLSHQRDDDTWIQHVDARLSEHPAPAIAFESLDVLCAQCPNILSIESLYERFAQQGFHYGASFQVIHEARQGENSVLVTLHTGTPITTQGYSIHPALLDGAFQALALLASDIDTTDDMYLPASMGRVTLSGDANSARYAYIQQTEKSAQQIQADVRLLDEQGRVVLDIHQFSARRTTQAQLSALIHPETLSYVFPQWQALELEIETSHEAMHGQWGIWKTDANASDRLFAQLSDVVLIDEPLIPIDTLENSETLEGILYPVNSEPDNTLSVLQSVMTLMQALIKQDAIKLKTDFYHPRTLCG